MSEFGFQEEQVGSMFQTVHSICRLLDSNSCSYERVLLEQEGRGETSMVLNNLTSGIQDPKSGGGGTGVLLGTLSWLFNQ